MEHMEVMYLGLCSLPEWTLFCVVVKKLEWFRMVQNGIH